MGSGSRGDWRRGLHTMDGHQDHDFGSHPADVAYGAPPMEDRIKVAVIGTGALEKNMPDCMRTCAPQAMIIGNTIRIGAAHRVAQHGLWVSLRWKRPLSDPTH